MRGMPQSAVYTCRFKWNRVRDVDRTVHPRMQRAPTSAVTAETERHVVLSPQHLT